MREINLFSTRWEVFKDGKDAMIDINDLSDAELWAAKVCLENNAREIDVNGELFNNIEGVSLFETPLYRAIEDEIDKRCLAEQKVGTDCNTCTLLHCDYDNKQGHCSTLS